MVIIINFRLNYSTRLQQLDLMVIKFCLTLITVESFEKRAIFYLYYHFQLGPSNYKPIIHSLVYFNQDQSELLLSFNKLKKTGMIFKNVGTLCTNLLKGITDSTHEVKFLETI